VEFNDPVLCRNEEPQPNGLVDYLISTLAQNLITDLRIDRWYKRKPDKRLANNRSSRPVELLGKELIERGRKITRRKLRMFGMRSQPEHGWPTVSQCCEASCWFGPNMPKECFCFLFAHRERDLSDFIQLAVQNLARISPSRARSAGKEDSSRCAFDDSFDEIFGSGRPRQGLIIVQGDPTISKLVFE
jgi:hypothetical protein